MRSRPFNFLVNTLYWDGPVVIEWMQMSAPPWKLVCTERLRGGERSACRIYHSLSNFNGVVFFSLLFFWKTRRARLQFQKCRAHKLRTLLKHPDLAKPRTFVYESLNTLFIDFFFIKKRKSSVCAKNALCVGLIRGNWEQADWLHSDCCTITMGRTRSTQTVQQE